MNPATPTSNAQAKIARIRRNMHFFIYWLWAQQVEQEVCHYHPSPETRQELYDRMVPGK